MEQRKAISRKINQNSTHMYDSSHLIHDVHCNEWTSSPLMQVKKIVYSSLWKQALKKWKKWHWWHCFLLNLTSRNKGSVSQRSVTQMSTQQRMGRLDSRSTLPQTIPISCLACLEVTSHKKTLFYRYSKFCTLLNINPLPPDQKRNMVRLKALLWGMYFTAKICNLLKFRSHICAKFIASTGGCGNNLSAVI